MKLKQEPTLNPSPPHNPPSNSYNWHTNSRSSSSDMDSEIAVQVVIIFHILAFLLCIGCVVTWSILLCGKQRYNQQKAANIVNLFINCLTEASILVPAAVLTADLQNYSDFAYQFTGTYYVVLLWLGVFFFTPAFAGAIALICCVPKNASARRNSRGNLDTEAMMLIQASGSGQPQPPHGGYPPPHPGDSYPPPPHGHYPQYPPPPHGQYPGPQGQYPVPQGQYPPPPNWNQSGGRPYQGQNSASGPPSPSGPPPPRYKKTQSSPAAPAGGSVKNTVDSTYKNTDTDYRKGTMEQSSKRSSKRK